MSRLSLITSFVNSCWFLDPEVLARGIRWIEDIGTPEFDRARRWNRENRESLRMSLPGNRIEEGLLSWMSVHLDANGIATVPVYGVLVQKAYDLELSETGTSSEMLADTFEILSEMDKVKAVILDVDSPGGSVSGIQQAAESLRELSNVKPTVSVVNEMMASGAYYLGSQTGKIVTTEAGYVGSIGVFATRVDASRMYDNVGLKVNVIKAGEYKAESIPTVPMSDGERGRIQEEVDYHYEMFKRAISVGRGLDMSVVERLANGKTEIGTVAVEKGYADELGTLKSTYLDTKQRLGSMNPFWKKPEASDTSASDESVEVTADTTVDEPLNIDAESGEVISTEEEVEVPSVEENLQMRQEELEAREAAILEKEQAIADEQAAREAEEEHQEIVDLVDPLVEEGSVLPKDQDVVIDILSKLDPDDRPVLVGILSEKQVISYGEVAPDTEIIDLDNPAQLKAAIQGFMEDNKISSPSKAAAMMKEEGLL
jgi:signal peptide peptidase SppA